MGINTPIKSTSQNLPSQGLLTPNGSRYFNKVVREKDGKTEIMDSRSNYQENIGVTNNDSIFRSSIQAARISDENFCHFNPRATKPMATVKIGNWVGRAMIDTGSTKTLVTDKIINQIGLPIIRNLKVERVNTINGIAVFDRRIKGDIILLGYKIPSWEVTIANNSPAFNNNDFDAIIGAELLAKLPPMLLDIKNGRMNLVHTSKKQLGQPNYVPRPKGFAPIGQHFGANE